ncbi:MAG: hypothetical protein FJ010_13670 [Chloroflexi bacterium]|nr:hypothetical protein [Chloroflexota bacterium]
MNSHSRARKTISARARFLLIGLILLGLSLACGSLPEAQPAEVDQGAVETAIKRTSIVQTVSAEQTRVAALQNPPERHQLEFPTRTSTPSATPFLTPRLPLTKTPVVVMISVSENTNCRDGPGNIFELVGALLVGEQTDAIAKDPSGEYWYVHNPVRGGYCWLWGNYATTVGNAGALPVFTPPPTPTFTPTPTPKPDFAVSHHHFETCGEKWYISYYISNYDTSVTFQSVSTITKDTATNQTVNYSSNAFERWSACALQSSAGDLMPGEGGFTYSGGLRTNPDVNTITATIMLCTADGLGETCVTKSLSFVP